MKIRGEAKRFLSFTIGRHSNFKLWHDPWVNNESLTVTLGIDIVSLENFFNLALVRTIINNGNWQMDGTNHVLSVDFRNYMHGIPICRNHLVLGNSLPNPNISAIWQCIRNKGTASCWNIAFWHSLGIQNCTCLFLMVSFKK